MISTRMVSYHSPVGTDGFSLSSQTPVALHQGPEVENDVFSPVDEGLHSSERTSEQGCMPTQLERSFLRFLLKPASKFPLSTWQIHGEVSSGSQLLLKYVVPRDFTLLY